MKNLILWFNGLFMVIFTTAILWSGLKDVFIGYNRWLVGIGCLVLGMMGIYYSRLFQDALINLLLLIKKKKLDKDNLLSH
jgi:hypothetical protein